MARINLLDTRTTSFGDLISNGKIYRVPPLQRDYSWTEETGKTSGRISQRFTLTPLPVTTWERLSCKAVLLKGNLPSLMVSNG